MNGDDSGDNNYGDNNRLIITKLKLSLSSVLHNRHKGPDSELQR